MLNFNLTTRFLSWKLQGILAPILLIRASTGALIMVSSDTDKDPQLQSSLETRT